MAAIDFPASPTTGQIFVAGNGVSYQWNGTLWLASGASAGGDFFASASSGALSVPSLAAVIFPTIVTGNSGNWYSTVNGRYTPPAGRFQLFGQIYTNANATVQIWFFKNGVAISGAVSTTFSAASQTPAASCTVDANGTDYFELRCITNNPANILNAGFGAFPISGIKGPPGDPGQLGFRLLQRTAVSSAVADVSIQGISSDINDLMFTFDLSPSTNAVDLTLQFYDNTGTLDGTNGHYAWAVVMSTHAQATGSSPFVNNSVSSTFTSGISLDYFVANARVANSANDGIAGSGTIMDIKNTARPKYVNYQSTYLDDPATARRMISGSGIRTTVGAITGVRLVFTAGNIASGAFSVWGSP